MVEALDVNPKLSAKFQRILRRMRFFLADVVFMGGTLATRGGHNILEPAIFGKPIVFGPHMQNFKEIAEAFLAEGASVALNGRNKEKGEKLLSELGASFMAPLARKATASRRQ